MASPLHANDGMVVHRKSTSLLWVAFSQILYRVRMFAPWAKRFSWNLDSCLTLAENRRTKNNSTRTSHFNRRTKDRYLDLSTTEQAVEAQLLFFCTDEPTTQGHANEKPGTKQLGQEYSTKMSIQVTTSVKDTTKLERIGAHSHITGLGVSDALDTGSSCGLIGQEKARKAMGLVHKLIQQL